MNTTVDQISSSSSTISPVARAPLSRRDRWLVAGLLVLCAVPVIAGFARVVEIGRGAEITDANARFLAMPLPAIVHIVTASAFALLGVFQVVPGLRRRHPRAHRAIGRVTLPVALVVAASGLWLTLFYPRVDHDGVALFIARLVVGGAMLAAIALSLIALVRRRYARHGEHMLRAYGLAMGAGTQVLTHLPLLVVPSFMNETGRAVAMIAGWAVNVVVVEIAIARGRAQPPSANTISAGVSQSIGATSASSVKATAFTAPSPVTAGRE